LVSRAGLLARDQGEKLLKKRLLLLLLLYLGADLTHNNLSPKMKPSIAALVGSLDRTLLKYAPAVGVQPLLEPSDEDGRPRSQEVIFHFLPGCKQKAHY
jgi:hypothetical protein